MEVTTKRTLDLFSLGLSGAVVQAKSCVKVEVPRVHESCPMSLWKAVFFISLWIPASICPAGQNTHIVRAICDSEGVVAVVCTQPVLQRE